MGAGPAVLTKTSGIVHMPFLQSANCKLFQREHERHVESLNVARQSSELLSFKVIRVEIRFTLQEVVCNVIDQVHYGVGFGRQ
jgi:hypothetical protein